MTLKCPRCKVTLCYEYNLYGCPLCPFRVHKIWNDYWDYEVKHALTSTKEIHFLRNEKGVKVIDIWQLEQIDVDEEVSSLRSIAGRFLAREQGQAGTSVSSSSKET